MIVLRRLVQTSVCVDCLQAAFSLKTRQGLDLIQRDCKQRCYYIRVETRREKTDCWLFCSKQTLRQPRNGVTDWSIAQLLTDHWLVCGEIASNKNSHASQTTANNSAVYCLCYSLIPMHVYTKQITNREDKGVTKQTKNVNLRKHPFLLAHRCRGRFARRNVCDSATEIPYWWRKSMFT